MPQWVSRQSSEVIVEPCGELRAVYIVGSGLTHLVDITSSEVLCFLASSPKSESQIRDRVAQLIGDPEVAWEEIEAGILLPLLSAEMVERLP